MNERFALARKVAETLLSREGTGPAWGLVLEEAREGYARVSMEIVASIGTAHGGMIFALADTAFAYACNSRNETTVAQSASITFLAPAKFGERLIAEATEQALAGRTGAYRVSVRTEDGRVIADFLGASRTIGGSIV
jgi:acyl-CoA thioesterase